MTMKIGYGIAVCGKKVLVVGAAGCLCGPGTSHVGAQQIPQGSVPAHATAELKSRDGQTVGHARLSYTPNGVLVTVTLSHIPAGEHAFHIHEAGRCEPPTFESAGGHFNPLNAKHGFLNTKGPHAGDLPNITLPATGRLRFEFIAERVAFHSGDRGLLDVDGSALVVHAKADDYATDPAGAAGERIACGVVRF
jgi:Cu-Zn family superoxide dismutase